MRYFINQRTNEVHAYDDDAPEHFVPSYLLPMSDDDVQSYITSATAPQPSIEGEERKWRDAELADVMWLRERHRDQLEIEAPTTLAREQFKELLVYIQALRDWPQSSDFPDGSKRPDRPEWAVGLVE